MRVFWGLLLVVLGLAFLGDNLRWYNFDVGYIIHRYWPVILVALGGWLIFEKSRNRKNGEWASFDGREYKKTIGDLRVKPASIDGKGLRLEEGIGDIELDLSNTTLNSGENRIDVSLGIGDIRITLPHGVPASVSAQAGVGDVEILNQRRDGFGKQLEHVDPDYSSADIKIHLFAKVGLGDVRVTR